MKDCAKPSSAPATKMATSDCELEIEVVIETARTIPPHAHEILPVRIARRAIAAEERVMELEEKLARISQ